MASLIGLIFTKGANDNYFYLHFQSNISNQEVKRKNFGAATFGMIVGMGN